MDVYMYINESIVCSYISMIYVFLIQRRIEICRDFVVLVFIYVNTYTHVFLHVIACVCAQLLSYANKIIYAFTHSLFICSFPICNLNYHFIYVGGSTHSLSQTPIV